jgi:histidinol-phosphatase
VDSDLEVARRAALTGGALGLKYFADLAALPREQKPDGSVVTEADRAVEAAIRRVLGDARPGDSVLGEEGGQTGHGDRRWIVDPIDGTAMFVAGDDRWLVLVALEEAGEIVAGVAAVPAVGRVWWASRGGGAYEAEICAGGVTGERRIQVRTRGSERLAGSRLGIVPDRDAYPPLTDHVATLRWRVHPALLVASGQLDVAVQPMGEIWDFASNSLIVEEAGGRYTRLDSGAAVFSGSAPLHAAVLGSLAGGG